MGTGSQPIEQDQPGQAEVSLRGRELHHPGLPARIDHRGLGELRGVDLEVVADDELSLHQCDDLPRERLGELDDRRAFQPVGEGDRLPQGEVSFGKISVRLVTHVRDDQNPIPFVGSDVAAGSFGGIRDAGVVEAGSSTLVGAGGLAAVEGRAARPQGSGRGGTAVLGEGIKERIDVGQVVEVEPGLVQARAARISEEAIGDLQSGGRVLG